MGRTMFEKTKLNIRRFVGAYWRMRAQNYDERAAVHRTRALYAAFYNDMHDMHREVALFDRYERLAQSATALARAYDDRDAIADTLATDMLYTDKLCATEGHLRLEGVTHCTRCGETFLK